MHSRITTALFAAAALMLASCASESETKLEPGQKAFVFESGVVPIGDFDPWTFEIDELFDPCNEISDEEFARAGFAGKKLSSTKGEIESPHGTSLCTFDVDEHSEFSVVSSNANHALAKTTEGFLPHLHSSVLPEMYFYQPVRYIKPAPCYAQVDTDRGAIVVIFGTGYQNYPQDDMCAMSRQYLEALYQLNK